jgi:WD40 repeat protein
MIRRLFQLGLAALLLAGWLHAAPPVTALSWSRDGQLLAVGRPRSVELLRPPAANAASTWTNLTLPKVRTLAFHPDGRHLWVAGGTPGESGALLELNLPNLTQARRIDVPADLVESISIHPDGRSLAHTDGNSIRQVALQGVNPSLIPVFSGHSGRVLAIAHAPGSPLLLSVATDRSVKVWTDTTNTPARSFGHHTELPHAIAFQPGAAIPTCATAGDDRTVRIWQPGIGRMVRIIRHHEGSILALGYAPDGRRLYTAGTEGLLRCIDASSDEVLHSWTASPDWINSLAVHPATGTIATGDARGDVLLWNPDGSRIAP